MNRYLKIGLLLVFAVAICLTSGKVFNHEIGTSKSGTVSELGDSTACFAQLVEGFSYYEYLPEKDCYLLYGKSVSNVTSATQLEKAVEPDNSTECFAEIAKDFYRYEYNNENDSYLLYDTSENLLGKALFSMPYCAGIKGYAGNVPLVILLSPDDKVQKVFLLENSETPSFQTKVVKTGILEKWDNLTADEAIANEVDAVTGATYTSTAIIKSVKLRLEKYVGGNEMPEAVGNTDEPAKFVGKALFSMPYCADIKGYAGNVPLVILLSPDDKVQKVFLLENSETPSFQTRVVETGILDKWNGLSIGKAVANEVDAVTGATYTSSAIIQSVKLRLEKYLGYDEMPESYENIDDIVGFIITMCLLMFAGFCFWEPQRTRKYRIVLLLASIGILGFWMGQVLSIAKLSSWLVSGVNWKMDLFIFIVFAAGILAPLFLNKQFYCMYVCPFGACQELVGKINPKHKLKIPPKAMKVMRYARYVLLALLGALLCISLDISIENFEPFSAFKFQFASLSVLILAGVILLFSVFINRPWCNFLCPTGAFFSLFMKKIESKNGDKTEDNGDKE